MYQKTRTIKTLSKLKNQILPRINHLKEDVILQSTVFAFAFIITVALIAVAIYAPFENTNGLIRYGILPLDAISLLAILVIIPTTLMLWHRASQLRTVNSAIQLRRLVWRSHHKRNRKR